MTEPRETPDPLKRKQRRRVVAAAAARDVLASRTAAGPLSAAGVKAPEVTDLVALASWIVTGEDPWPTNATTTATRCPLDDDGPDL